MATASRLLVFVCVTALCLGQAGCEREEAPPPEKPAEKDIIDTAVAAGTFKTLAKALETAGLVETLKGKGPFTVFAPTDAAFDALPAGALDGLLKDVPKLKAVLLYHVVDGKVMAADARKLAGKTAKTVEGREVPIALVDDALTVGGAKVTQADVKASNGVIHVIDKVLMPPEPAKPPPEPAKKT